MMKKFKIKSKTPENIIKTKVPEDNKQDFSLPPKKEITSKTPDKNNVEIPSKSGLKENIDEFRDKNSSLPKNIKEKVKTKVIPTDNGKKTKDEKDHQKMNKSLPIIAKKKPKHSKEPKRRENSLETPKKINAIITKEIITKKPKKEKQNKSPPKFLIDPPKTKIKEKSPK